MNSNKLDICCGSAYSIIQKDFEFHKICARGVPKQLTDEQKWAYMETRMQVWQQYCEEREAFLTGIVTDNETRGHH
jgi:hypothetical protein